MSLLPFASAKPHTPSWMARGHSGRPVAKVSQVINVKDEEMLSSAITLAAQKGWLMVGGQPVHSVLLTDKGAAVAVKKSGHSNAPTSKAARVRMRRK